jgi:hypothetical protein
LAVIATMCGRSLPSARKSGAPPRGRPSRHLHVHQHDIIGLTLDRLDGLDAVRREVGAVAHLLQDAQRELLVHRIVLGQEDAQRMAARHRRVHSRLDRRNGLSAPVSCARIVTSVSKSWLCRTAS